MVPTTESEDEVTKARKESFIKKQQNSPQQDLKTQQRNVPSCFTMRALYTVPSSVATTVHVTTEVKTGGSPDHGRSQGTDPPPTFAVECAGQFQASVPPSGG